MPLARNPPCIRGFAPARGLWQWLPDIPGPRVSACLSRRAFYKTRSFGAVSEGRHRSDSMALAGRWDCLELARLPEFHCRVLPLAGRRVLRCRVMRLLVLPWLALLVLLLQNLVIASLRAERQALSEAALLRLPRWEREWVNLSRRAALGVLLAGDSAALYCAAASRALCGALAVLRH